MSEQAEQATYALAPQGVYMTAAGEGILTGVPMAFVRLAGCPVGCGELCDTDFSVAERVPAEVIARRVAEVLGAHASWTWVTGGEPTIHDLRPLLAALRRIPGARLALATAGIKPVREGRVWGGWDFISVSPHAWGPSWVHRTGSQLNVVPGLNGLRLEDMPPEDLEAAEQFPYRYVTPCEGLANVTECWEWVKKHPGWRLGVQAHKVWQMP